jgi:hypothetical protein
MALTKDVYELSALPSDWLNKAVDLLAKERDALDDYAGPTGKTGVIQTLSALASMLQAPLPDETGLDLYILALAKMPTPVFNAARNKLVLVHRWPRLPLPADFIEHGKDDQQIIDTMRSVLASARLKAERALARQLRT